MANARIGALRVDLGMNTAAFEKGLTGAERRLNKFSGNLKKLGSRMQGIGRNLSLGLTAPLVAFGYKATEAAIRAEEMESAFDVVFGKMSADVRKWAEETGDAMGRSTQEIQRGAMAFQELFGKALNPEQAAKMSKEFAVLTQDLASFKDLSNEVAQQKLFSGLTGEAEPLRAVGVFINAAAVDAKLLELGLAKVNGKFTDQQKIVARAAIIQEQLAAASGDVLRTGDSTANQIKTFSAAMEELSVKIGDKLLPAITPVVSFIARMVDGFAKLSPGIQTTAVVIGGLVAAIGPLLIVVGSAMTVFAGLGAAMAPVALVAAGIAAVGLLIYKNWDTIGPVLEELWGTLKTTLGPPLMELIRTVKTGLTDLWNGPLGDAIRAVLPVLAKLQAAYTSVLGQGLAVVIKGAAAVLKGLFGLISDGVGLVASLFKGEWSEAFNYAFSIANRAFGGLPEFVIGKMRDMVQGIKAWVVDKLGAVWNTVSAGIDVVKGSFFDLYDAVVGHSYVPDMVDGIAGHMARLDKVMVEKAVRTTKATKAAFRELAGDIRMILDQAFPDAAALRGIRDQRATLNAGAKQGLISQDLADEAGNRLSRDLYGGRGPIEVKTTKLPSVDELLKNTPKAADAVKSMSDKIDIQMVRISKSFGDMVKDSTAALKNFADAVKGGGFFDILDAAVGLFTNLAGTGLFGGSMKSTFGGARAAGGPVSFGKSYLVGEKGPEMFTPGASGHITPNGAMGGGIAQIVPSPYFDVVVDGRIMGAAPAIAAGGASSAISQMGRMRDRILG